MDSEQAPMMELTTVVDEENQRSTVGIRRTWPLDEIDPTRAKFPCCIVWTPLPIVSWLAPYIGHVGICREDGAVLDFAGSNFVNVDNFAYGAIGRYLQLERDKCCFPPNLSGHACQQSYRHAERGTAISWDDALNSSTQNFQHKSYNLFTCNCHSFVANCLNRLAYNGSLNWNVINLVGLVIWRGKWVNKMSIIRSFLPFVAVTCVGIWVAGWAFLIGHRFIHQSPNEIPYADSNILSSNKDQTTKFLSALEIQLPMPGIIQVSVVELIELPKSDASSSSFTLKVAMGKREYQILGNGDCSFPLTSLRENMNVEIFDVEGNELFQTEFRTILVVEKGLIEDSYPLKFGGYVHIKLQFLLSHEELIRIRNMRESALKRKHGEQFNTEFIGQRNGNWITYSGEKGAVLDQTQKRDPVIEANKEKLIKIQSPPDATKKSRISSKVSLDPQSKLLASSISSGFKEERSQRSNVRKMISALESTKFQDKETQIGPGMKSSVGTVALKSVSSEESDILKPNVHPIISKSFSSGMLSDFSSQPVPKVLQLPKFNNQEVERIGPSKVQETEPKTVGIKYPSTDVRLNAHVNEAPGSLKRDFKANETKLKDPKISEERNAMASSRNCEEPNAGLKKKPTGEGSSSREMISNDNASDENKTKHLQISNVLKTEPKIEERDSLTESRLSRKMLDGTKRIDQLDGSSSELGKEGSESKCLRSHSDEEIVCTTPSVMHFDKERCLLGNYGVCMRGHLCITTGSRQLRDLVEVCTTHLMPDNPAIGTDDQEKRPDDAPIQLNENENENSEKSADRSHENPIGISKSIGGFIEQGVRIAVLLVACGTLLFNNRLRLPKY